MDLITLPSRSTLEDVPLRSFKFLIGLAASPTARAALADKGFDEAEHTYAWSRLQRLGQAPAPVGKLDAKVRAAAEELDSWDEPNFPAMEKTLLRQFPAQSAYVFNGVEATQGAPAILGIELVLDRLDNLESGKDRDPTSREADAAAIALLAKRGYHQEERARLRALIKITKTIASPAPLPNEAERSQLLVELYRWLSDWSAHAKTSINSRRTLIQLGLAKPRSRDTGDADAGEQVGAAGATLEAK